MESLSPSPPAPKFGANGRRLSLKNADPCMYCGEFVEITSTSAARGEMAHRACMLASPKSKRDATCESCGKAFIATKRTGGIWIRCCSRSCSTKIRISEGTHPFVESPRYGVMLTPEEAFARATERSKNAVRTRRARLADVPRDAYTVQVIAERDEFRCGLCGDLVHMNEKWPAPRSASVDHVLPLARGGDDTLANVQLAHLRCNLSKRDRV